MRSSGGQSKLVGKYTETRDERGHTSAVTQHTFRRQRPRIAQISLLAPLQSTAYEVQ